MEFGVKDIVERVSSDGSDEPPKPPEFSVKKPFTKKWVPKRRPVVLDPTASQPPQTTTKNQPESSASQPPLSESERIHMGNIRKLQTMTPEEIEREREEIFKTMDPAVLQSLLRRAEIKEAEVAGSKTQSANKPAPIDPFKSAPPTSSSGLQEPSNPVFGTKAPSKGTIADWDPAPEIVKPELAGLSESSSGPATQPISHSHEHTHDGVHFPPTPADLKQYFPDLPVETEKLAWMQPIDEAEDAEYSSQLTSVAPSELRFDFKGNLVTPRQSRAISTSEGLHHHGDAPTAAGYTVPELAHLCRSSHPAQRSLAIQTAGRVLHKIRLRKFARSSDLQEGLEALIPRTRILETLSEAADERTRNVTVKALAIEALWLANTDNGSS